MNESLWVVMPVFNEETCIQQVLDTWIPMLRSNVSKPFKFLVLDDGSTDQTPKILEQARKTYPELKITYKENSGHGQTCIQGYREAIQNNSTWVFQIDSDGQCDPAYFSTFWKLRESHDVIFGYRAKRQDGMARLLISRILSLLVFILTWTWIRDPNVPYRLMKADILKSCVDQVPADFYLANIAISFLLKINHPIHWVDIEFLDRIDPISIKPASFVAHGIKLRKQLRDLL